MLRTAFYIVERAQPNGGEVKEMEPDPTEGLAPIEVSFLLLLFGGGGICLEQLFLGEHVWRVGYG